jgi:hypothetical protein
MCWWCNKKIKVINDSNNYRTLHICHKKIYIEYVIYIGDDVGWWVSSIHFDFNRATAVWWRLYGETDIYGRDKNGGVSETIMTLPGDFLFNNSLDKIAKKVKTYIVFS